MIFIINILRNTKLCYSINSLQITYTRIDSSISSIDLDNETFKLNVIKTEGYKFNLALDGDGPKRRSVSEIA